MKTVLIEVTQGIAAGTNYGKFLVGRFDAAEWERRSLLDQAVLGSDQSLLWRCGWSGEHLLVLDLQTGEGAIFRPGGAAGYDLNTKHRVHVCPMFQPFLEWLYKQNLRDLDALPELVELPEASAAMYGYRREGAK